MIPKIIHYCWFGGNELPEMAKRCINSWKQVLPEYKIMRWDESNFDVNCNTYVKEAYENKKYAFVADYVRLYAMYTYGGIYMDTDVEVLKPLDKFLVNKAFSGFENYMNIPTGIMACEKGYRDFKELLSYYNNRHFVREDGTFDLTTNVEIITNYYLKYGLMQNNKDQTVHDFTLFTNIVFCPEKDEVNSDYMEYIYTIHHKYGSWLEHPRNNDNIKFKLKLIIKRYAKKILGKERFDNILRKRATKRGKND